MARPALDSLAPARRLTTGAVVVLGIGAAAVAVVVALVSGASTSGEGRTLPPADGSASTPGAEFGAAPARILVHVSGAVAAPGVFELDEGARAVDAVAAAGGFAADADPSAVNLARVLVDGEQLRIPEVGESPAGETGGLVNLNTADASTLDGLPGIGPALAQRIIAAREERPFASVDDLDRVSGIGPKVLESVRPLVTT